MCYGTSTKLLFNPLKTLCSEKSASLVITTKNTLFTLEDNNTHLFTLNFFYLPKALNLDLLKSNCLVIQSKFFLIGAP